MDAETRRRSEEEDRRVVSALRFAGTQVDSVYDLLKRKVTRDEINALLRVLPDVEEPVIKEGIVRALTDRAAKGAAARPLVAELRRAAELGQDLLAWAIGNALTVVADESVRDDLLELVQDRRLGGGRQTVAEALARFKNDQEVVDALVGLLEDEEVAGHAIVALRKLKAREAKPHLEPFLDHPKAWVRKEAKKALQLLQDLE